jgi:hypothetical protein
MNKNQYALFTLKAIKFIILILIIDFFLGTIAQYLFFKQSSGKYARITYSLEKANEDILIFGNSHANRHYIPAIFQEKLNLSCYNAGVQGQEILFHSTIEEIITNRTKPKIIILNIDKDKLFKAPDSYDRLSDLYPYYSKYSNSIKPTLKLISQFEYLKMSLKSYRYNSTIVHIVKYFLNPQLTQSGYIPLSGKMTQSVVPAHSSINNQKNEPLNENIDINFVNALNRFIQIAKRNDINLIFVASPTINGLNASYKSGELFKEIIEKNSINFIDFSNDARFIGKYELFHDESHLNNEGARLFSELLSDSIYLKINPSNSSVLSYNNSSGITVSNN